MSSNFRLGMCAVVFLFASFFSLLATAQTAPGAQPVPSAPVPAQLLTAKKVFISNAGMDANSFSVLKRIGEVDQPYDNFYDAVKKWGRYELVSSPADADLIFELRFVAPLTGCHDLDSYAPQLSLTIMDAKTHFVLWSLRATVEGAWRKATWNKNFNQGLTNLMDDLKKLASPSPASVATLQK